MKKCRFLLKQIWHSIWYTFTKPSFPKKDKDSMHSIIKDGIKNI